MYKIGPGKSKNGKSEPQLAAKAFACQVQGSSSISFERDWGTDKDTMAKVNQYLIKFSYAY